MANLVGYTLPLSSTGKSALVPAPPWHFSGEVLMVEFIADADSVSRLLPDGLELPRDRPGRAAAIFGDWQSCTDEGGELLDPVRSQYREFYIALACRWHGENVVRCPFCWVDKDFSLVRGLIQGYPKKMGNIAITTAFALGKATPQVARGGRFSGTLAAGDRRLAQASVTLESPLPPSSAPSLMLAPLVHTRRFPSWDPDGDTVDELVSGGSSDQLVGDVFEGSAELEFFDSPNDELSMLRPIEILRGYRMSFAETITGGRLLTGPAFAPSAVDLDRRR